MTPSQQREILSQTHAERLREVEVAIQYMEFMIASWLRGNPFTTQPCPDFEDVCHIVLDGAEDIPPDRFGYNEASLRALSLLAEEDRPAFEAEVERVATTWLWGQVMAGVCEDAVELPNGLLEPF